MNLSKIKKLQQGFTLIELLVVIGILAVLLAITLIAINPAHQFAQANNTKRRSDILQILNAIGQYTAENKGNLPADVVDLVDSTPTAFNSTNFSAICADLISGTPAYIPAFPTDPSLNVNDIDITACNDQVATPWDTGYTVERDNTSGRITVAAPNADEGVAIDVTR